MRTISQYHRPSTIDEALALLSRTDVRTRPIGGGTSLVGEEIPIEIEVVDLQLACPDSITDAGDAVKIGAMARLQDLVDDPLVPPLLRELALREGPNTLRNAATLGGTIASADPESELLAGLLVHKAGIAISGRGGTSEVSLPELLADPSLLSNGIIVSISVAKGGTTAAARTGRTPADTSIVAAVGRSTASGNLLAVTGVASTPILVTRAEIDSLNPPSDFRGSPEYRRGLAQTLAARVLSELGGAA
jgi:CO/xanthine dehydrogenase FAD-binding subunit